MQGRGYSPYTCRAYRKDLRQLAAFAKTYSPEMRWSILPPSIVENWMLSMAHTHSPESINRKLSAVKRLYQWFFDKGFLDKNPMRYIKRIRTTEKLPNGITKDEADEISRKAAEKGIQTQAIIATLRYTGLRIGELRTLTMNDVDLANGRITVCGKGNRWRMIPISDRLHAILKIYLEAVPPTAEYVFSDANGNPMGDRALRELVTANMRGHTRNAHPHAYRHGFATVLIENGTDIETTRRLLGHKNIDTTARYIGTSMNHVRNAVNAL